jgi:PKD repeat protein
MKIDKQMKKPYFFVLLFIFIKLIVPTTLFAADSVCARVQIEIRQELTFERQAFDAHMGINNGLASVSLENINVDVLFSDEAGNPVVASSDPADPDALFFIRVDSMTGIDDVNGNGSVAPATTADIHWLIIPAPGAVADAPEGKLYYVGARLTYTMNEEEHTTVVTPDFINVKPLPLLTLDYFLPDEVYGDDPFTAETEESVPFSLGVRLVNNGYGTAHDVKIDSAQPQIVDNAQGLLVDFLIIGSETGGETTLDNLLLEFGDIEPSTATIGRWLMTSSLSGRFVDFSAEYSHADELGGQLTSIIEDVNTHFLVQDVLVDLPGRDAIRDFLGRDDDILRIYESDAGVTEVLDQSAQTALRVEQSGENEILYSLTIPPTDGFVFGEIPDPQQGNKVITEVTRSDGKNIQPDNCWLSKKRVDADWFYSFNIFDSNTSGIYTVKMVDPSLLPKPPVFEEQEDPVVKEGQELVFIINVTDPDNPVQQAQDMMLGGKQLVTDSGLVVHCSQLPVGAEVIDLGNGRIMIRWTPREGQAGHYPITVTASDGEHTTKIRYHLTVTGEHSDPTPRFSATPNTGEAPLEVQFTDESLTEDGITTWLWDFGDGSTGSTQNPVHIYETPGSYTVSLTVTEIDGDEKTISYPDLLTAEAAHRAPALEFGTITVDNFWSYISLTKTFNDPVVVAMVTGAVENDPCVVRLRDIDSSGFNIRLQEGSNSNDIHNSEEVSYVVIEAGSYTLENGFRIAAGHGESSATESFSNITFADSFDTAPIVTASVSGVTDVSPAWIALRGITPSGFEFKVQAEEGDSQPHSMERVDYIAWQPGFGIFDNIMFESGFLNDADHRWQQYDFNGQFNRKPSLVASLQTYNESDPANVRVRSLDVLGMQARIAEETSGDSEVVHAFETIGFIALSIIPENGDSDSDGINDADEINLYTTHPGMSDSDSDGIDDASELSYWGTEWNFDLDGDGVINLLDSDSDNDGYSDGIEKKLGFDPSDSGSSPPFSSVIEIGEVQATQSWIHMDYATPFIQPIVVAQIVSHKGGQPSVVRIDNVSTTGFDIRLQGDSKTKGKPPAKNVTYMVIEKGSYTLDNGKRLEADSFRISDSSFTRQQFTGSFEQAPVVLTTLASVSKENSLTGWLKDIDTQGFDYLKLENTASSSGMVRYEEVSYIACESFSGVVDGLRFDAGRINKEISSRYQSVRYSAFFQTAPLLLTGLQTANSLDPVVVQCRKNSRTGFEIRIKRKTQSKYKKGSKGSKGSKKGSKGSKKGGIISEMMGYIAIEAGQ